MPRTATKVTISLPPELLEYADAAARALGTNRSMLFQQMLRDRRHREEERLAIEGYREYAAEAAEYAAASAAAVSEAISDDDQAW